jgi:hypothetical protein
MKALKALFQWMGQDSRNAPALNRIHTDHKISLQRLIELLEVSGEAPRLLKELRRERERLDQRDFESKIW